MAAIRIVSLLKLPCLFTTITAESNQHYTFMEKIISSPHFSSDYPAKNFLDLLIENESQYKLENAVFYYAFPSFRDYEDELYRSNILILSPNHGVIAISLCESIPSTASSPRTLESHDESLSQFYSILFGRLIKSRLLRKTKTELLFPFKSLLYAPGVNDSQQSSLTNRLENDLCNSFQNFTSWLASSEISDPFDTDVADEARSIIEGAKAITRPVAREISLDKKEKKAILLQFLESQIANFDAEQKKAAITLLNGPQRIRGLAGTGKTVVLAMKAAQIHLDDPTKSILYTFYTKSLYGLVKRFITRFYRHYKDSDPDWNKIHIRHAWGGMNLQGVYNEACLRFNVPPIRFKDVPVAQRDSPFNYVCGELLSKASITPVYDSVLIDEGQDLDINFFRLCHNLTKGGRDEKNIIWAYDELQNIFEVKVRTPRELFGEDPNGEALIDLERAATHLPSFLSNDIVLHKSYRNPMEILICAHALGFGLYSKNIVQMLENKDHWVDVGYEVEQGAFLTGAQTVIVRPQRNSPLTLSEKEPKDNIVQWFVASGFADEFRWITTQIKGFLEDGLRPEEILVISLDDRNARKYFDGIVAALIADGILCNNILDNPYTSPQFSVENKITLSTVHRAKGNEAAAVIVVGIDALFMTRNSRTARNRIFTAFTRSKAWLRVSGIGDYANFFIAELSVALKNSPRLEFTFPDLRQVELLQRDINKRDAKLAQLRDRYRKDLDRLGLTEEEAFEFFSGGDKQ